MKVRKVWLPVLILTVLVTFQLQGDEVTLKCGRKIRGRLVSSDEKGVVLETFGGKRTIPAERVKKHDKKKVSNFEKYEAKLEELGADAKGQIKLAQMCIKGRGWDRAREHLKKALELDPENKKASKLLKSVDKKEKQWLAKLPKPRAVVAKVALKQDLPKEEIEALGEEVKKASKLLSRITGKEIYFSEVIFTPLANTGHLIYDKTFTGMPNGWTNIPMGVKNWGAAIIAHELGHACLKLNDCDNAANGGQWGKSKSGQPCLMAHNWKAGFCSICSKQLRLGKKYAQLLVEEIPEPPETKVTIAPRQKTPGKKK